MAKKKTAKKTTKKTGASAAGRSTSKKTTKKTKTASKSSAAASRTVKKTAQKATGTKKTVKKTASKASRTTGKSPAKKPASTKKTAKTDASKPETRKAESAAAERKPAPQKPDRQKPDKQKPDNKPEQKPASTSPDTSSPDAQKPDAGAEKRKGITVVEKKRGGRQKAPPVQFPTGGLLAPGGPRRKPLIPSGPKNVIDQPVAAEEAPTTRKSPFNKRQLEKFRTMLLDKRRELLGDITGLESEALKSADGADPRLGEHLEDQGSDAIDQAVSLDLAAADRRLLRMIDDALERIDNGTFGLCVVTGKPIREERLRELPWASLSIEAARAEERRQMGRL